MLGVSRVKLLGYVVQRRGRVSSSVAKPLMLCQSQVDRGFQLRFLSTTANDSKRETKKRQARPQSPSPLVLPSAALEPEPGANDTEVTLMGHMDPFSLVSTRISPAVMHAFRDAKNLHSNKPQLTKAVMLAEKLLLAWNRKLSTGAKTKSIKVSFQPQVMETARKTAEREFHYLLKSVRSEDEHKAMAAFMSILLPRSLSLWNAFDSQVADLFASNPRQYMELALLASYSIFQMKKSHSFWSRQKGLSHVGYEMAYQGRTPSLVIRFLADLKTKQQSQRQQQRASTPQRKFDAKAKTANTFNVSFSSTLSDINMGANDNVFEIFAENSSIFRSPTSEVFAPVGGGQVRHSKDIEILGLQLTLMGGSEKLLADLPAATRRDLLEDMSNHCSKVLGESHTPIKLVALREIWENAPLVDLPNAYSVYKKLNQQVIYSINCEPLQLLHQDEGICSLLECMLKTKFKSSLCISKIFEIMAERGMDYQNCGVRMFNALVQLDAIQFAKMVLSDMIESSSNRIEILFTQSNKGMPFNLPNEGKQQVLHALNASNQAIQLELSTADESKMPWLVKKKRGDVLLALFCFNRVEKQTPYSKILEQLEASFLPHIRNGQVSSSDVVGLIYSYALAGRMNPFLFHAADVVIREAYQSMDAKVLSTLLWSFARLNYRPDYLHDLLRMYLIRIENITQMSTQGAYAMSKTLWAAAVLEVLDINEIAHIQPKLFAALNMLKGVEMHTWMLNQFSQMEIELEIRHANDSAAMEKVAAWKQFLSDATNQKVTHNSDNKSSWTHLDASRILLEAGISHENEKRLSNGYIADIFVPPSTPNCPHKGVVLEFDGPFHYESYLRQPTGPTVMKQRHIAATGYKIATVTYWEYQYSWPADVKKRILETAIAKAMNSEVALEESTVQ